MAKNRIVTFNAVDELALAAADDFVVQAKLAILDHGAFHVALSGGNTPKYLFDELAKSAEISWSKVHLYWGDERCVPLDSEHSNYRMAKEHLLSKIPIPKANVHPINTRDEDKKVSARHYEDTLKTSLPLSDLGVPTFDLVYLGMGADGHTASLFPGTKLVKDLVAKQIPPHQFVAATWVEKLNADRITLLPSVINQAHRIVFLIAGEDKSKAMKEVFDGEYDPEVYPSQLIRPADKVMCVLV